MFFGSAMCSSLVMTNDEAFDETKTDLGLE